MFELEPTAEIIRAALAGLVAGWVTLSLLLLARRRRTNRRRSRETWQRDRLSPALSDTPTSADDGRSESELHRENIRLRLDAQQAVEQLQSAEARNRETMRRMAENQVLVQENEQAMGRVKHELDQMREFVTGQLIPASSSSQAPFVKAHSFNSNGSSPSVTIKAGDRHLDAVTAGDNGPTSSLQQTTAASTVIDLTDSHGGLPGDGSQLWTALTSSNDETFERQWSAIKTSWDDVEGS